MSLAYLWIAAAVVAGGVGTFLQAIGSARGDSEPRAKTSRRRFCLAAGTLLTAFAVYALWSGQQQLTQEAAAKPVVDVSVDLNKVLLIRNVGTVDLEAVSVDATIYTLKGEPRGNHVAITGIDSFSKIARPIWGPHVLRPLPLS